MAYTPSATISNGLSTALAGTVEPGKFIDVSNLGPNDYYSRRMHGPSVKKSDQKTEQKTSTLKYSIIIVIISAIIFVTMISIYDVVRASFNILYSNIALTDPNSHNDPEAIQRVQISNRNQLWSTMTFCAFCIVTAVILVAIAIYVFHVV